MTGTRGTTRTCGLLQYYWGTNRTFCAAIVLCAALIRGQALEARAARPQVEGLGLTPQGMQTLAGGSRTPAVADFPLNRGANSAGSMSPEYSCGGLLMAAERKSVEPMAARLRPDRVQAARQSLHHFVAQSRWSDEAVLTSVRRQVLPVIECRGPIVAWTVDDT